MASVTSLDQDMKQLRLGRYTPQAANEIRRWIEEVLGERLAPGDLMDALKDGVALCKLINLAVSPGVRYKASNMPFVQMENISHFLKACEMHPLSLPAHDRFLTVDLYDNKDPAQVLQCIAAFSRRANTVNPSAFPNVLGAKSKGTSMSPDNTGPGSSPYTPKVSGYTTNTSQNATSPQTPSYKSNSLSRGGLATGGPVSSWSKREDETKTAPAWNIHQYGYMGGASQGNQGVSFGARRQITTAAPEVPSLAEKEKRLREKLEREQRELAENEHRIRVQREAEEAQAQEEEQRKWGEETRLAREEEDFTRQQEESRLRREQQAKNDQDAEAQIAAARNRQRTTSDARLNGQFLSQYQASQKPQPPRPTRTSSQVTAQPSGEAQRIAELERQLAEMKAQAAERERQEQQQQQQTQPPSETTPTSPLSSRPKPSLPSRPSQSVQTPQEDNDDDDWTTSERDFLRKAHQDYNNTTIPSTLTPIPHTPPSAPQPTPAEPAQPDPLPTQTPTSTYSPSTTRTSRFLSSNHAPTAPLPKTHIPPESAHSTTIEIDAENSRRLASQTRTKAGGWASTSLLEREKERERERQREWEENQKLTASTPRDPNAGVGPGGSWDVHQYGYMGGDSQNRGGPGMFGGARRQVVGGPRPMNRDGEEGRGGQGQT